MNVAENVDAFRIEVAAPGLTKEDFNVKVEKDLLTVSAKKESQKTEGETTTAVVQRFRNSPAAFPFPKAWTETASVPVMKTAC